MWITAQLYAERKAEPCACGSWKGKPHAEASSQPCTGFDEGRVRQGIQARSMASYTTPASLGIPKSRLHVHTYPLHPKVYMLMWFDLSASKGLHKAKRFADAILEKQSQQKALKPPLQRSGAERFVYLRERVPYRSTLTWVSIIPLWEPVER